MANSDHAEVGISIIGDLVDPDIVSRGAGIAASRGWKKGDSHYGPKSKRWMQYHTGVWSIEFSAEDVETAANKLLRTIETVVPTLRAIANQVNAEMVIKIWWDPEGGQGGFGLRADLLRRLLAVADRFECYFPG